MSDYLWDKTGEPDAEVERLEALLGGLGHAPRPLVLPAPVVPFERRPSGLSAPVWLAALAAALLLASLLVAAAFLRARPAAEGKSAVASETLRSREDVRGETPPRAPEPSRAAPEGGKRDEKAAVEDFKHEVFKPDPLGQKGKHLASAPRRRQRLATPVRVVPPSGAVPAFEAMSMGGGATSLLDSTRLKAKEQLVYALRLTGAKLRDVRLRTQGRDESGPPSNGRAPIR